MQKGRLLIIDDEERLRNLLARILQLEGYEVATASTGKEDRYPSTAAEQANH